MKSSIPYLLSLTSFLSLYLAAASPPDPQSHFTNHRIRRRNVAATLPLEYIEVTRPLPFSSLTPSCTLDVLSYSFGNTISLPPTNTTYYAPENCTWSRAALHLSGASNGSQYDRIAAVWLGGAEILRTSTPEPTSDGIFWNIEKDISKYSSLLRQPNVTLSVMLENVVNDVYTGVYLVNITFLYYDTKAANSTFSQESNPIRKTRRVSDGLILNTNSSELNENPADLIIPISASGDEELWFRIERESDSVYQGIQIPLNTYRAVIEVYVSFHGNDEFWYSNPPDTYIEQNNLPTKRGHGSYREVLVKLDDNVVGSVIPFPVIFTGGINPLFWEPVVSIGAFDLPSYEIELTPLLGTLLDGKVHYIGLGVDYAIPFWLVDANLHLWLDHKVDKVQAHVVKYDPPSFYLKRKSKFQLLDGKFKVEGERESKFSGWVNSSAGNFTTYVTHKVKFENEIEFKKHGTEKKVDQEVKVEKEVSVYSDKGTLISRNRVTNKYPLEIKSTTLPGSAMDTYLMNTELEHAFKSEEKLEGGGTSKSTSENTQKSKGWMFVQDHDFVSGAATTDQSYSVHDSTGCFSRKLSTSGGEIMKDSISFLCAAPL